MVSCAVKFGEPIVNFVLSFTDRVKCSPFYKQNDDLKILLPFNESSTNAYLRENGEPIVNFVLFFTDIFVKLTYILSKCTCLLAYIGGPKTINVISDKFRIFLSITLDNRIIMQL